jgi:hypothetical protein
MRKLLKKYGFVLDQLTPTIYGRMALLPATSASRSIMSVVGGGTIERRTRISRPDDGSARCKASRAEDQPNDFFQLMHLYTTPSMSNVI